MIDYYNILGVPINASKEELKKAYLKKCKAFHPDLHGSAEWAEEQFKSINEAYEVLYDAFKRQSYDSEFLKLRKAVLETPQHTQTKNEGNADPIFMPHPSASKSFMPFLKWGIGVTALLLFTLTFLQLFETQKANAREAVKVNYQYLDEEKARFLGFCAEYPNVIRKKSFDQVLEQKIPIGLTYKLRLKMAVRDTTGIHQLLEAYLQP
jgi:curved DNA-binding protein CbpA